MAKDFSKFALGKKKPLFDPHAPKFAHMIHGMTAPLPPPPASVDYTTRVDSWPMFDNDSIGDCTIASVAHLIQLYTSFTKASPVIVEQANIVKAYSDCGGYDGTPATDNGAFEINVLKYWMSTGINAGGIMDKISGFAKVNPLNSNEVKYAVYWFGGLYIGMNMPKSWQTVQDNKWKMGSDLAGDNAPGTWGGHAVPVVAYDEDSLTIISWGDEFELSWDAFNTYCEEAWAVISPDFMNQMGKTPSNFDWPFLLTAMSRIQEGSI